MMFNKISGDISIENKMINKSGFTKNNLLMKISIGMIILTIFIFALTIETTNEDEEIIKLDLLFDYYSNIKDFNQLDKYCKYVLNGKVEIVSKLVNKEICNCPQYKIGQIPKWFNLHDIFFSKDELGYLYRIGFTTNLDEFRSKKSIEMYHMKTGEKNTLRYVS